MKFLAWLALLLPVPAVAADFVEAVKATQLTGLENTYPAWSLDGSKIVFESTRDGPDTDIFVMNADGAGVVQLTRDDVADSTPVFTPDGRFIVWASELDGNLDVFRMAADGSGAVNLTRHPGTDGHPRVSPDGRRVYFNSNRSSDPATFSRGYMDREHNHEICSMALDGVRSESGRNSEVFWMDPASGETRNVTNYQACDGWPAWSPDGRFFAFASNRANVEFEAFDIAMEAFENRSPRIIQ